MTIRTKLVAILCFLIGLTVALGAFVLVQMAAINQQVEALATGTLPALNEAVDLKGAITRHRAEHLRLLEAPDQLADPQATAQLSAIEREIDERLRTYQSLVATARQRQSLAALERDWSAYVAQFGADATLSSAGEAPDRTRQAIETGAHDRLLDAVVTLGNAARFRAADALEEVVAAYDMARSITIATLAILVMFGATIGISQALDISDGLRDLQRATRRVALGDLTHQVVIDSGDELEAMAADFRTLIASLCAEREAVAARQADLHERNLALERAYDELQKSTLERAALSATVRALATPVLPVQEGVLVIPLVGLFDAERATQFTPTLLAEVERARAHTAIVDVTGLAVLDEQVAAVLVEASAAIRLLGARTVMVGIRPELAQLLVGIGLDLGGLVTRTDLRSGVAYALAQR